MGVYDPKNTTVNADGKIVTGFSEGTMIQASKDEEGFSVKVSAKGETDVAISNNNLGTITVTLSQTSPFVSFFNKLANSKKIFPIWGSCSAPKEKFGGTQAMVKKPADIEFSDETSGREFEIQVLNYKVE
ncbi:DUF3277 domain-containing protein [Heyndrickxia sporothermodurans]|uniref:phage structural protein n=1 Tax=Heyndrickxia sporothermodurans TaxID=46224 RepID=UPI002DB7BD14|nr:DUF3277 domain-containing protein [Heyndrickxia sporothermodurans]MEB6549077.1 DUF3277 domain-containing protein [Heyndrickxia sporothermodurans]